MPGYAQVLGADGDAVAIGELKPSVGPPLEVTGRFPALSLTQVMPNDIGGPAFVFDFGQNMAGMVSLTIPPHTGMPKGTTLRIEHAEIIQGRSLDIGEMCRLCPGCSPCTKGGGGGGASGPSGAGSCDSRGKGAACDTYCHNPSQGNADPELADDHPLRHEPCFPHQSYVPGFPKGGIPAHDTPNRYIGCAAVYVF